MLVSILRLALVSSLAGLLLVSVSRSPPARPTEPISDHREAEFRARLDAALPALADEPRLSGVSHDERYRAAEFVVGNLLYVSLHEIGHALIDTLDLGVLGREEDAADAYATVTILDLGASFSHNVLTQAMKGMVYAHWRDHDKGRPLAFYHEHGLSLQRAYQIVCLMVGSNSDEFENLAIEAHMPKYRRKSCKYDWRKASSGWSKALEPYRRVAGQPEAEIKVVYEATPNEGGLAHYAEFLQSIRFLETIGDFTVREFHWSTPFTLEAKSCGEPNAMWSRRDDKFVLCYELAAEFADLHLAYKGRQFPSRNHVH